MLIVSLTTLSVEMIQLMFALSIINIDDIILNCSGGLIGILVYRGLYAFLKNEEKVRTTMVLTGFIIILIPVLVISIFGFRFRLG
jgi:glycopeptide antibiotics resistance protein